MLHHVVHFLCVCVWLEIVPINAVCMFQEHHEKARIKVIMLYNPYFWSLLLELKYNYVPFFQYLPVSPYIILSVNILTSCKPYFSFPSMYSTFLLYHYIFYLINTWNEHHCLINFINAETKHDDLSILCFFPKTPLFW